MGHVGVGWGGSCRGGVGWGVMQGGWGVSCRGGGVCHAGVGCVMQGWGGVGHVGVGGCVIHVEELHSTFYE